MARTPKNVAAAQLASTTLTTIYTVPANTNASAAVLAFTNTTANTVVIDIYHGTGTDLLQKKLTLPAGSGKERIYYGFQRRVLNATQTVKIQADVSHAFNYSLSVSEVEL
jgi:hypothetical protein